jgi:hypothetical protein
VWCCEANELMVRYLDDGLIGGIIRSIGGLILPNRRDLQDPACYLEIVEMQLCCDIRFQQSSKHSLPPRALRLANKNPHTAAPGAFLPARW